MAMAGGWELLAGGVATFSLGLGISFGGVEPEGGFCSPAGAQPLGQGWQQSLCLRAAKRARMRSSRLTRWAQGSQQGAAAGAGAGAGAGAAGAGFA